MRNRTRFFTILILAAGLLAITHQALAGVATFSAIDSGFVTEAGGSAKGDGTVSPATFNYSVGYEVHYAPGYFSAALAPMDRNNYFVFDLFGVSDPIISASLVLWASTLESVDGSEVFDVVAPVDPGAALADSTFLELANSIGPGEFDDAGDPAIPVAASLYGNIEGGIGTLLASEVITSAVDDSLITIDLLPAGVDYLNIMSGGVVMLGGSVSSIAPGLGTPQQPFGFTGPDIPGGDPLTPMLVLTTAEAPGAPAPLPATLLLMLVGLAGLRLARRG